MIKLFIDQGTLIENRISHEDYKRQLELAFSPSTIEVVPNNGPMGGYCDFAIASTCFDGEIEMKNKIYATIKIAWKNTQALREN